MTRRKRHKNRGIAVAVAGVLALSVVGTAFVVPVLALAGGAFDSGSACGLGDTALAAGESPPILGRPAVAEAQVVAWWNDTNGSEPLVVGVPVDELVSLYFAEAAAEGVRGDLALVQAIFETGWFTSGDTARNNFAGIAHYDGLPAGQAFPDLRTGVRAHVQLLKKYAEGNDVRLANPDVAPDAGARATTWGRLTGTWATDPTYAAQLSTLYASLLAHAGQTPQPDPGPTGEGDARGDTPAGNEFGIPGRPGLPGVGMDPATTGDETAQVGAGSPADGPGATDPAAANAGCAMPGPPDVAAHEGTPGNVPLATAGGFTVHADIARQVAGLVSSAHHAGYTLTGSGYRSPERQVELRRAHCGTSHYAVYEMPSSRCSPPTARPGSSNHELGLALDIECNGTLIRSQSTPCFQWLAATTPLYGLHNLPSEPWHWSVDGT